MKGGYGEGGVFGVAIRVRVKDYVWMFYCLFVVFVTDVWKVYDVRGRIEIVFVLCY